MNQRVERVAAEIREILGDALIRGEIHDPRVQQSGLVTVTHVRVTGDLREAKAMFTVHQADEETLARVREGLNSASGFLRRLIGSKLRLKVTPSLAFEVDRVFDQEAKIDALLREVGGSTEPPK
jgi:ribosome-binding factor A